MPSLIYWHQPDPNKATDWTNWFWTGESFEDYGEATARCEELTKAHGWRHDTRWLTPVLVEEGRFPPVRRPPYLA